MTTIYVDGFKGGVGKTTTSYWLARALSEKAPTLLIGTSPQNDILDYLEEVPSVRRGLREALGGGGAAQVLSAGGMDLLPAGYAAAPPDAAEAAKLIRETIEDGGWGYVVIDGFNFVDELCVAGLMAADVFIAPTTIYPESTRAVIRAFRFLANDLSADERPPIAKVLLTQVPTRSRRSRVEDVLLTSITDVWASSLFATQIRRSTRYSVAELPGEENFGSIRGSLMGDRGVLREDYHALADELVGLVAGGVVR